MFADLRLALRSLASQPALTAAVVLPVGLAIAANTALFSVMDGVLFRPLPYRDAERLVHVDLAPYTELDGEARKQVIEALGQTSLLSERARVFRALLFEEGAEIVVDWQLVTTEVSPSLFAMLGVSPAPGRSLRDEDEGLFNPRPAVLGYDLWQSRFGGDPKIVGRTVGIPGAILDRRFLVVGVMPPGFDFPRGTNVWVARAGPPRNVEPTYARLAPGVTVQQAAGRFRKVRFTPLREFVRPKGGFAVAFLLAATGLLMLVAWAQVAALLFARAAGRASEIAVRLALGASRWRLVRQFASEGGIVAVTALALAWAAVPSLTVFIVRLLPSEITVGQAIHPDQRTFLFACLLSATGVFLLALAPFEIIRRSAPLALLRGDIFGGVRMRAARIRTVLLVAQLAVTAMLLYLGGLAFHSFVRVTSVDLGFTPDKVLAFRLPTLVVPTRSREGIRAAIDLYVQRAAETMEAVRALPDVKVVGAGDRPFMSSQVPVATVTSSADPAETPLRARNNQVLPGYFETLGVRVLEGRGASERDLEGDRVALVNETLARDLRRFGPVVGQQLRSSFAGPQAEPYRVVGVVNDFVNERPDLPADPQVFLFRRSPNPFLLARVNGDVGQAAAAIRTVMARIWADRSGGRNVVWLADEARRATAEYRARTILLAVLGLLCLPLALAGVGGALSYALRQQTREIAIRLAVGAEPGSIRRRVVGRALVWAVAGLLLGLAGGLGAGRWMSSYLFGVPSADPLTAIGVASVLAITAWVAALWPASRAARVDPAVALRDM